VALLPPGSHGLVLGPEVDRALPVEVGSSQVGLLVACEREHGQWHWDGQIDTDLSSLDFVLELSGYGAVLSEERAAVSVLVRVNQLERLGEVVHSHDVHHGSEDFLVVTFLAGFVSVNNSGSHEVSVREVGNLGVSSVEEDLEIRVFLSSIDNSRDPSDVFFSIDRSNINIFKASSNSKPS